MPIVILFLGIFTLIQIDHLTDSVRIFVRAYEKKSNPPKNTEAPPDSQ